MYIMLQMQTRPRVWSLPSDRIHYTSTPQYTIARARLRVAIYGNSDNHFIGRVPRRTEMTGWRNRSLLSDIAFASVLKGKSRSELSHHRSSSLAIGFSSRPHAAPVKSRRRDRRALYNEGTHVSPAEEESA